MLPATTRSAALVLVLTASAPALGWAAGASPGASPGPGASELLQLIGGLLLVIAAVFVSARFLPRLQHGRGAGQDALRILDSLVVGQKQRVVLMQVGSRQVLVGITPVQVTALHVLEEPVAAGDPLLVAADSQNWLARILGRRSA